MTRVTTTDRRAALREKLIELAAACIREDGIGALKARKLAADAGCSVGAIYNVFGDLGDLVLAVNGKTFRRLGAAYLLLGLSLWLSTDVPLATKGFWAIGVLLLTLSLVNFVKYRFDARISGDRTTKVEEARNERLLDKYADSGKAR